MNGAPPRSLKREDPCLFVVTRSSKANSGGGDLVHHIPEVRSADILVELSLCRREKK